MENSYGINVFVLYVLYIHIYILYILIYIGHFGPPQKIELSSEQPQQIDQALRVDFSGDREPRSLRLYERNTFGDLDLSFRRVAWKC